MNDKLKPCPFCGGEAVWIFDDFNDAHDVSCKKLNCFAFRWKDDARYITKEYAENEWNRRVGDPE